VEAGALSGLHSGTSSLAPLVPFVVEVLILQKDPVFPAPGLGDNPDRW